MKKILLVIAILLTFSVSRAQVFATANSPEYNNIMKMSVALFTQSTFQMGYERFFEPNTSFFLGAGLTFKDTDYDKAWGVRTEAQMRFHVYTVIRPKDSHRLYFAPYLLNQYYETEGDVYDDQGNPSWQISTFDAFGAGMLFGWSYSFANRINLDIYTGGGIRKTFNYDDADYNNDNSVFDYGYSGIIPRLGIDIGFWF